MCTRFVSMVVLASAIMFSAVGAATSAVVGSVNGPDNSPALIIDFENTGPDDILQISFDSSSTAVPFVWTNAFVDPAIAPVVSGTGTSSLVLTWAPNIFDSGDIFGALLLTFPGVIVSDLIGVVVNVVFEGGNTFVGQFVDNPAAGEGLSLAAQSSVPLPTALPLLATGLLGLAFLARSRRSRKSVPA